MASLPTLAFPILARSAKHRQDTARRETRRGQMSYDRIEVRPLAGSLGAEVRGVDLRRLDNQTWSEVHQAFLEFHVLTIRDQELSPEDIMTTGRRFGEPNFYPFVTGMDGYPYIFEVIKEPGETRNFGGG